MDIRKIYAIAGVGLLVCLCAFSPDKEPQNSFTLIEMFTSEGCSSCPMADELLDEMMGILNKEGKHVYGLAFHVTYWDRLGWKDPYSDSVFTERQKKYVALLHVPRPYTPQAVVNGQEEFVGSNPFKFRELVTDAEMQKPQIAITGKTILNAGLLEVNYHSNRQSAQFMIHAALVEKYTEHYIPRGENKKRTLKHYNVVRVFASQDLGSTGVFRITWPEELKKENSELIIFAQHRKNLKVVGGASLSIN